MARPGISYSEFEEAANQIQAEGRYPTIDSVRHILKTGSRTTIANYLKTWEAQQQKDIIPPKILASIANVWEEMRTEADARITELKETYEATLKNSQNQLAEAKRYQEQIAQQLKSVEQAFAAERNEKQSLTSMLQEAQQTIALLSQQEQNHQAQLATAKEENHRLHELANTIQKSFEHYQTSIQEQRQKEVLQHEQLEMQHLNKKREQQKVIDQLQQTLSLRAEEKITVQQELALIKEQYVSLDNAHKNLNEKSQILMAEVSVLSERTRQLDQILSEKIKLLEKSEQLKSEAEKRSALLEGQLYQLQKNLQSLDDKTKILESDKQFLLQEKVDLLRQLKQKP